MGYPYADPSRFEGLLHHAELHLGELTYGLGPEMEDGSNRGFGIGLHAHPELSMVSAVTTGVRFHKVDADLPLEFVVSALPDQEDEAAYLVHVVAERAVQNGQGFAYGGGYVNAEPLIPGTGIEFLLASPHPFVEEEFDLFPDLGEPALRFVTMIPATRAEFEFVRQHGDDPGPLFELWQASETDLLDVHRASAV